MKSIRIRAMFRLLAVVAISLFIEVGMHWKEYIFLMNSDYQKNVVYEQSEIEYLGWREEGHCLVSEFDSIFYIEELDMNLHNIRIEIQSDQTIPYTEVFYTNEEYPVITGELRILEQQAFKDFIVIDVDSYVKDIRIDLSDLEGIRIENIRLIFNYVKPDFSFVRVIAINLIYWAYVFLFRLQRPPKYDLE